MNLPILPPSPFLLLVCRGRTSCGYYTPTKLILPPIPDDVAGSPHPPVPNPPATFDLPGLAVGNGDGLILRPRTTTW